MSSSSSAWRATFRKFTCGVLLIASALLLSRTISHARMRLPVNAPVTITPFPNADEREKYLRDVVGTFATGKEPGDRVITISADGQVRFTLLGPAAEALAITDHFDFGRRGKAFCLATLASGPIDVIDIDKLRFGDVAYERVSTEKPR